MQRALVVVSKIVQSLSNATEFEPSKPHSKSIDTFLSTHSHRIPAFITKLLDHSDIEKVRNLVSAHINDIPETIKFRATHDLIQFLESSTSMEELENHQQIQVLDDIRGAFEATDWKTSFKKKGIEVFSRKYKERWMNRINLTSTLEITKIFESIMALGPDKACQNDFTVVNIFPDESMIKYVKMKMPFPLTKRDALVKVIPFMNEKNPSIIEHSIQLKEIPRVKGTIRADIMAGWVLLPKSNQTCLISYIVCFDFKGSIPTYMEELFLVNTWVKFREYLEKIS